MNKDNMPHSYAVSRKIFSNAGLALSYLDNEIDSTDVPIVLLHGFTASAERNWLESGWIERLSKAGRRVIALDARGHGHSEKPYDSEYYPSNVMMEDSVALLKQLNIPQADYCGFSMGARMSTFAAIQHPDIVRKLLIGGMGINLKNGVGNPEPIAEALKAKELSAVKDRKGRRFRRIAEAQGNDLTALAHCILSSRQPITADCLAKITAETLIVVGDKDDTGGNPYGLAPFIPRSQAVEIAGCHHFNALTHERFRETAIEFIR